MHSSGSVPISDLSAKIGLTMATMKAPPGCVRTKHIELVSVAAARNCYEQLINGNPSLPSALPGCFEMWDTWAIA